MHNLRTYVLNKYSIPPTGGLYNGKNYNEAKDVPHLL